MSSDKLANFGALMRVLEQASSPLGGTKSWLLYNAQISLQELERTIRILVGMKLSEWKEDKLIAAAKGSDFLETYRLAMEQL